MYFSMFWIMGFLLYIGLQGFFGAKKTHTRKPKQNGLRASLHRSSMGHAANLHDWHAMLDGSHNPLCRGHSRAVNFDALAVVALLHAALKVPLNEH